MVGGIECIANLLGMRLGTGTLSGFGATDHLLVRDRHCMIALGCIKRVTEIT